MAKHRKHRGVSLGTMVMLAMTILVLLGMGSVLPRLYGSDQAIDQSKMLQAFDIGDMLPQFSLSEIPIQASTTTAQPVATPGPMQTQTSVPVAATASPQPTPTAFAGGKCTIVLGGSVNMSSTLRKAGYFSEAEKYDFTDTFSLLMADLQGDYTMVSLENTIDANTKLSDVNTVEDVLPMLSRAGVKGVALGFKQIYDSGFSGLTATVEAVQGRGMHALGAYITADAAQPTRRIMTLGGVRVALLHYTDGLSSKGAKAMKSDGNTFAVAQVSVDSGAAGILEDVAAVRSAGAQVVIVSLNWSAEGKTSPTKKQTAFAQQLADAGVDVIVGTGSRVIQKAEWLTGTLADGSTHQTLCAYSLGSLLNESRTNANVAGMLLRLTVSVDGQGRVSMDEAAYVPTYIWRYKQDGRYYYRVVASDQPSPDGMGDDQTQSRERALATVQKYLGQDTPLTLRKK